jgi:hypothetical protein
MSCAAHLCKADKYLTYAIYCCTVQTVYLDTEIHYHGLLLRTLPIWHLHHNRSSKCQALAAVLRVVTCCVVEGCTLDMKYSASVWGLLRLADLVRGTGCTAVCWALSELSKTGSGGFGTAAMF